MGTLSKFNGLFLTVGIMAALFLTGCGTTKLQKKREYTSTEKARMLIEIANGALVEGDPTGALQSLVRAEQEDASLPELYHSKAIAYFYKYDLNKAILSARKAVRIKPDYSDANNTLGKLLLEVGKYDEAIPPLKKAADDALNRESYKAWTNLGIISYKKGEFDNSKEYFNRAIEDSPSFSCIANYYLGHLEIRKKNFKKAIANYSRATQKLCATFGEARLALGMAYQQSSETELARKTYLEIQKRYPNTKLADQALDQLRYLP